MLEPSKEEIIQVFREKITFHKQKFQQIKSDTLAIKKVIPKIYVETIADLADQALHLLHIGEKHLDDEHVYACLSSLETCEQFEKLILEELERVRLFLDTMKRVSNDEKTK